MITKESLKDILVLNNCNSKEIAILLNKKILLKYGKSEYINQNIRILKKHQIDLTKCATVIAQARPQELKKTIKILVKNKLDLNKFISVLVRNDSIEISNIIKVLKEAKIDLNNSAGILSKGNSKIIPVIIELLNKHKLDFQKHLSVLSLTNITRIKDILDVLKNSQINPSKWLTIVLNFRGDNLSEMIEIFEKSNYDPNNFVSAIAFGKKDEIESMVDYFEKKGIDVNKCASILAKGKKEIVENIITILEKYDIDYLNCLSLLNADIKYLEKEIKDLKKIGINLNKHLIILARGNHDEKYRMIRLLKRYGINISECPTVLAYQTYADLNNILRFLKYEQIDISSYLSILVYGKYNNIKNIVLKFKKEKIDISLYLEVLNRVSYVEVNNIIRLLKINSIDINYVLSIKLGRKIFLEYKYFGMKIIFENEKKLKLNEKDIKFLFYLYGYNNQYYDKNMVNYFCARFNIKLNNFIELVCNTKGDLSKELVNKLKNGGSIWVGKTIPMTKEQLEKYADLCITVANGTSVKFYLATGVKTDQSYDLVLDTLMNRTGGLIHNYEHNIDILTRVLIMYCYKSLYAYLLNNLQFIDNKNYNLDNQSFMYTEVNENTEVDDMDFFKQTDFDSYEKAILQFLNRQLQIGNLDYKKSIEETFNLTAQEYSSVMERIKQKIKI